MSTLQTWTGEMTERLFTIDTDKQRAMIRLTLSGLWDVATVDLYAAAAQAAFLELTATGTSLSCCKALIDLRRHGVQPRQVTERIQLWLSKTLSEEARHAVLVSGSSLHRLQAQRLGFLLNARLFMDEAEACAWLVRDRQPEPA